METALEEIQGPGYEDDLNKDLKPWIPRARFLEISDFLDKTIEDHEILNSKQDEEEVLRIFHVVDEDGSGFIEADEVERMAEKLKIALTQEEKDGLLRLVEDDCKGAMNFDEFYNWYSRFKPSVKYNEAQEEHEERIENPLAEGHDGEGVEVELEPLT